MIRTRFSSSYFANKTLIAGSKEGLSQISVIWEFQ